MSISRPSIRLRSTLRTAIPWLALLVGSAPALADTLPPAGTPRTVSADPQATAQVNGVVRRQVTVGRTVYATGGFTEARPAGVAIGGAGTVVRPNLLAYDIVTGQLDSSFVHALTGNSPSNVSRVGRALAVSPNGRYLFVVGDFTAVDGQARKGVAGFDLSVAGGQLMAAFPAANGSVLAVAATDGKVFVGGNFTSVDGQPRRGLAAYDYTANTIALNASWAPRIGGRTLTRNRDENGDPIPSQTVEATWAVQNLVYVAGLDRVVIGGLFDYVDDVRHYSIAAAAASNGSLPPAWGPRSSSFPVKIVDPLGYSRTSITDLSSDGSQVYVTEFRTGTGPVQGTFEGRWAIKASDGTLVWLNDCVGDSYSSFPIGPVLYSSGHAHSCKALGNFEELSPQVHRHGLAETTSATGTNVTSNTTSESTYPSYVGQPAATLLQWYPRFTPAPSAPTAASPIVSQASQAGWSVTGAVVDGVTYVAYGGEFTRVEGIAQQGLVRFRTVGAARTSTENRVGPNDSRQAFPVVVHPASSSGVSRLFALLSDPDNQSLTFDVYRADDGKLLATQVMQASKTLLTRLADRTGIKVGTNERYDVVARDPYGNQVTGRGAIDDYDYNMIYGGSWTASSDRATYDANRTIHHTSSAGATVERSFYGTSVKLVIERRARPANDGALQRNVGISIDGGTETVFDTSIASGSATVYQYVHAPANGQGLAFGLHTIRIRNLSAQLFVFDGLDVSGDRFYDDTYTDNGVAYSGPWTDRQSFSKQEMNGGTHYTSSTSATASLTFAGTQVAVVSRLAPSHDVMTVTVDGTRTQDCDAYAPVAKKPAVLCSFTGLAADATHTVVVKKKSGGNVVLDGFLVR